MKQLAVAAALCGSLFAADFSAAAGAGVWNAEPSGKAQYKGDRFDVSDDTGLEGSNNFYVWGALEHPLPLLPNVRIERNAFSSSGSKTTSFEFDRTVFTGNIDTDFDLDQLAIIGYYILPIPVVDIRLGLGADTIDGKIAVSGSVGGIGQSRSTNLSVTLPIVYAGVRYDFGTLPIGIETDIKYIGYGDSSLSDYSIKIDWTFLSFGVDLAVEAGYRAWSLVIDDLSGTDAETDISVAGAFAGLSVVF